MLHTTKDGRTLYCVVWVFFVPKIHFKHGTTAIKMKTRFDYVHAENQGHARGIFHIGKNYRQIKRKGYRLEIIEVAPVIGWHAEDDNGDSAQADYNSIIIH